MRRSIFSHYLSVVIIAIATLASAQTESDSVRVPETKNSATIPSSRTAPFTLTPKDYSREVIIDSTGQVVTLREQVFGSDITLPATLSFKEYLKRRIAAERARMWSEMAGKYTPAGPYDPFADLGKLYLPIKPNPIISIFGKPGITLNVGGAVDIRIGIRSESSDQFASNAPIGTQISPIFDQNLQVNVNGMVGDKLKIGADWNTQRTFNFENQLHIRYDGYSDEIIQSVEAGNVSLPQTNSLISGGGALFGVKMGMKFGPLRLTAVASQRKGEKKTVSVSNGATGRTDSVSRKAYEYAQNHYFIDTLYRAQFERYYSSTPPSAKFLDTTLYVSQIEVWERTLSIIRDPANEREAICRIDAEQWATSATGTVAFPIAPDATGIQEHAQYRRVDSSRYHFDPYTGVLSLNFLPGPEASIAVAYIRSGPTKESVKVGSYQSRDSLLYLKLVKPQRLQPSMARAWKNQLKNIYSLGSTNVSQSNFRLDILYVPPEKPMGTEYLPGKQTKLVTIEGWDRLNGTNPGSDGKFDFPVDGKFPVYLVRGDLIFPSLEPFNQRLVDSGITDNAILFPALYNNIYAEAELDSHATRFQTNIVFSGTTNKNVIPLNAFSIVEGTVHVYMNGKLQRENIDYVVDYYGGVVTMSNPEASLPNSNVIVEFEQNDFFSVASKSLLGLRGDIPLDKHTNFGFTMINYNQKTLSDKVRLGEEPLNNSMIGIDAATKYDLPFLSEILGLLPGVNGSQMSDVSFNAEAALMLPNPNTAIPTIASDGTQGTAFIDDFEGGKRNFPLGVSFATWKFGSVPPLDSHYIGHNVTVGEAIRYKGRGYWYNKFPSETQTRDVFPNRSLSRGGELLQTLDINFNPSVPGIYNYPNYPDSSHHPAPLQDSSKAAWHSMMHTISGVDFARDHLTAIELVMKISPEAGMDLDSGKMFLELGEVSEDVIPNGTLNSEDGLDGGPPNGILNRDIEDRGLDTLFDQNEPGYNAQTNPDPAGDDYSYTPGSNVYTKINGLERNADAEAGSYTDNEDINHNGVIDVTENYYQYQVTLDTSSARNKQIVGGNPEKHWYIYRIQLKDAKIIGTPSNTPTFIRMWFQGFSKTVQFTIAELNLVGSQWEIASRDSDNCELSFVNVEENAGAPDYYQTPPGVQREIDRTQVDRTVYRNEQSLAIKYKSITKGKECVVKKSFPQQPVDVMNYSQMKLFVHGDTRLNTVDTIHNAAEVYFRFGLDNNHYYEYREPLRGGWNEIVIHFPDVTSLKSLRKDFSSFVSQPVPGGPQGSYYSLKGNPSLTNIQFFALAIRNVAGGVHEALPDTSQIWFDELRVVGADRTIDYAVRSQTTVKLADFGTFSGSLELTEPNFHRLEDHFGARALHTAWSASLGLAVEKILPGEVASKITIPLQVSHKEDLLRPRIIAGGDVLVTTAGEIAGRDTVAKGGTATDAQNIALAIREASETFSSSDAFSLNGMKLGIPVSAWYAEDVLNRLTYSFVYGAMHSRDPRLEMNERWGWDANITYGLDRNPLEFGVKPLALLSDALGILTDFRNYKINFLPSSITTSIALRRSREQQRERGLSFTPAPVLDLASARRIAMNWKQLTEGGLLNFGLDYSFETASSLLDFETDALGRERSFGEIFSSILSSDGRTLNFGKDLDASQAIKISTQPRLPAGLQQLRPTFSYSVNSHWRNGLNDTIPSKLASWNSSLSTGIVLPVRRIGDALWGDFGKPVPDSSTFNIAEVLRAVVKTYFFDLEDMSFTLGQSNSSENGGVRGGTGITNFWARLGSEDDLGPSRAYQLGLIGDPNGSVSIDPSSSFPFFRFNTVRGLRAPGASITDRFTQDTKLDIRTARQLWKGARLDLTANVKYGFNQNFEIKTDNATGAITSMTTTPSASLSRSFFTIPPIFFDFFASSIAEVKKKYDAKLDALSSQGGGADTVTDNLYRVASEAFEEGLETLPIFPKAIQQYIPRFNWSLTWEGLEKLPYLSDVASRVTLRNAYTGVISRSMSPSASSGGLNVSGQHVEYGFSPLVGMNFVFKNDILNGTLSATTNFNLKTGYDFNVASSTISKTSTTDISITATYGRTGLQLFGLDLKNDFSASLNVTRSSDSRTLYELKNFKQDGSPLDGSSHTQIEPKVTYSVSRFITASAFFRYNRISPSSTGSTTVGTTTIEGGFEMRLTIQ